MPNFTDILKCKYPKAEVMTNEPLSSHCTFRIGGNAEFFAKPGTEGELIALIESAKEAEIPFTVIGGGSNILFSDSGVSGLVITTSGLKSMEISGTRIKAGSGVSMPVLSSRAAKEALAGLSFASGIPGTLGGGIFMNAGAYDGEIADVLISTRYYDCLDGKIYELKKEEHDFSYRHSLYMEHGERIILSAELELSEGDSEKIKAECEELLKRRAEKQPLEYPSAGSAFKRYPGYFTAKLIDECGLKGYSVGGAQVSEKHAGFVINRGGATARDVLALTEHIKNVIKERHGIEIEREIRFIGEADIEV